MRHPLIEGTVAMGFKSQAFRNKAPWARRGAAKRFRSG
jgi:hypothetical protein